MYCDASCHQRRFLKITPDVIDLDQASGNDRKRQGQLGFAPLRGIAK
jgi:hypothetical protein